MGKKIGIDLGTTNTVVAIMDGPRPRVLDSRENRSQIRSVVGLKKRRGKSAGTDGGKGEILVGDIAVDNWGMAPRDTILSVKRLMGRGMKDRDVQLVQQWAQFRVVAPSNGTGDSVHVVMGDQEYSPVDISAMILKKAKEDAEFRLGEEVTHAVITVPAYFSQIQRHATQQAGLKAGLKIIKILDEPTAAAIAFGTDTRDENPKTLLVYDLGGGTFDVSLLMVAGSVFAPLNLEGDMWLGGDNLDQVIVDRAMQWVRDEYGVDGSANHRFMSELRKAAKAAKERLSSSESADLILPALLQDEDGNLLDVDMEISRDEFLRDILPLVGRYRECPCGAANLPTADLCTACGASIIGLPVKDGRTLQIVKKSLANANQTPDQVDYVLMAGNSSAVPVVQESMEELFGADKILRTVHPKQSVALGAAIVAAWGSEGMECQAPDPADPTKVCGKDNEPGAIVCEKCGAPLSLEEAVDGSPGAAMASVPVLGGVAPFSYGTQTAGDTFNIFIHKSDPFPTLEPATQTFFTGVPGQRMVSIPIYGGDHLEKASTNELQGQAFVLLPTDLPAETPVRIKLWLDQHGVFGLSAALGDGTKLDPWIMEGGTDAAVIRGIEEVEALMAEKADGISPQARTGMDGARENVFDLMKARDFDGAAKKLKELEEKVRKVSPGGGGSLKEKAESLIGFSEMVLGQFGWAFDDPAVVYRITRAVEETGEALRSGDEGSLEKAVQALDRVTDDLPGPVMLLLSFKGAIISRVHPVIPARAASLMKEVDQLEVALKAGPMTGVGDLRSLIQTLDRKITQAIEEADRLRPGAAKCASCGQPLSPGQRLCSCGADSWQLVGR